MSTNEPKTDPESSQDIPLQELASLRGNKAPENLGARIEEKISTRSAGRFFGKKTFSERIPLVTIALLALILALLALFFLAEPL